MVGVVVEKERVSAMLEGLNTSLPGLVQQILDRGTMYAVGEMKMRSPKRTGNLRRNVMPHKRGGVAEVYSSAPYARFVEAGWQKQRHMGVRKPSSIGFVADTRVETEGFVQNLAKTLVDEWLSTGGV